MQTERTHPVSHALAVAHVCAELALAAEAEGGIPRPLAASISIAANDAAARLHAFLAASEDTLPPDLVHRSIQAKSDLAAIARFAGLVLSYTSRPRDGGYIAKAVRQTANHAIDCLSLLETVIFL
jgi:hypothetical protein